MSAYSDFRFGLLQRIFAEWLTPAQVADELENNGFRQTCYAEIDRYRALGNRWPGAVQKPRLATGPPTAAPISPGPELPPAPEQSPATGEPGALDAWELEA